MDWFHCNRCFSRSAAKYVVSSCGHIFCERCITSKQCGVCNSTCSFLPITEKMKPEEKMYFMDPLKLIQSRQAHLAQIATFQGKQMEMVTAHFKNKAAEFEMRLREVTEQNSDLKKENVALKKAHYDLTRENAELKKPLSQRRYSPAQSLSDGRPLPIAVTSPVTPQYKKIGKISSESQGRARERSAAITTPGSSNSGHSSLRDSERRTPTSFSASMRSHSQTPQVFQYPFMSGILPQSPRY